MAPATYTETEIASNRPAGKKQLNSNLVLRAVLGMLVVAFLAVVAVSLRDTSAKEGSAAPLFSVVTDQGRTVTPLSFGGKVLVLNFWATWCSPCVEEIPSLNQFAKKFGDAGVVVIAISIDKNPAKYRAFLEKIPVVFQTKLDSKAEVSAQYGTFQYPETYIIKDGRVMRKFAQAEDWMSDDITQYVQSLL